MLSWTRSCVLLPICATGLNVAWTSIITLFVIVMNCRKNPRLKMIQLSLYPRKRPLVRLSTVLLPMLGTLSCSFVAYFLLLRTDLLSV